MKCSNCKKDMKEGWLSAPGELGILWRDGLFSGKKIKAWRCPKCYNLVLTTDP